MRIGELAEAAGLGTKAIRYYERIGLLPATRREPNGYRSYEAEALQRLAFIRRAQAAGLTLREIGQVLAIRDEGRAPCVHVRQLLDKHMADIEAGSPSSKPRRENLSRSPSGARASLLKRVATTSCAQSSSLADEGKEMAEHVQFTVDTGVQIYFCDPKSPWQRGSNENTNGLLRQYLPKTSDLSQCSQRELDAIARSLNTRPRQTLGWMTSSQAFAVAVAMTG